MTFEHARTSSQTALMARLQGYFSPLEQEGIVRLGARIVEHAGGPGALAAYKLMVAYGGGKDSSYTVAFLRAVQLHLLAEHGASFTLRVANMRHAGVPYAVMANIDRVYQALALYDDPRVELLVVDHDMVREFDRDVPFPASVRAMNRFDMLMNGHRTAGDGRPTFCNSCNLAVADFYGRAAWWGGGVSAVVTGDSRKEQKHYFTWIMRLAERVGLDIETCRRQGFRGLLAALDGVGQAYYEELYGPGFEADKARRRIASGDALADPAFISIYDLVSYRVDEHWELLTEFLGFQFDELAFSFTESDCANPMLMAHFRGLKAQFVQQRDYHDGIREYLGLAEHLMRRKEMPERLIEHALAPYATPAAIDARRALANRFAEDAFNLGETQLVCMQFAPFVDRGAQLERYLERCAPSMRTRAADLHALLGSEAAQDGADADCADTSPGAWLEQTSGLPLAALRSLYRNSRVDFSVDVSLIAKVRENDPHKRRIDTVDPNTGEAVCELVSGR
ncbi:hypothetical protein WT39_10085 [Burkholderia territorii]|nr:hypothetical protein WT39_10085 [Burkholderia territorii]